MLFTNGKAAAGFAALVLTSTYTQAKIFDNTTLAKVRRNLLSSANHSWELGVASEALMEYSWPSISVFSPTAFSPVHSLNATFNVSDVLGIAHATIEQRPANLPTLVRDGSAGDSASLGVAVLFANLTRTNQADQSYAKAATSQLNHLLKDVGRAPNGAISHRESEVQVWADFVYMAPPFIAYYGALQNNKSLLQEAYNQSKFYRELLLDKDYGLWRHVALGSWNDENHWATGNAWAAAGMLRVHQTLNHSSLATEFKSQQKDLLTWINQITTSAWQYQLPSGALQNVIDCDDFADSAGTALIAAVTYRMATLTHDKKLIPAAEKAYNYVLSSVDKDGWLVNAVDPLTFDSVLGKGQHSPEGQAFVLLLHSARREYDEYVKAKELLGDKAKEVVELLEVDD